MNIEIESIKRLNFPEILAGYSITPKQKTNQGFMTHCPFHDDKNPSLSVTENTDGVWLWRCFACNIGGTVIDFVMRKNNLSLPEAIAKLKNEIACLAGRQASSLTAFAPPRNDMELLKSVTDFYHKTFFEDKRGVEYLKSRGIHSEEIIRSFKIGFVNGSLRKTLSYSGSMTQDLKEIGILNQDRNEVFYNSIVIPLLDEDSNVVSLYGRNIQRKQHLYLKGPHKGLVNRQGAFGAQTVTLTESVIDALSLYELGVRNVIPCYGTGGFTKEHEELLLKQRIEQVEICFDSDAAGINGARALGDKYKPSGAGSLVKLPDGIKDLNDFLLAGKTKADFESLERIPLEISRTLFGSEENSCASKTLSNNYEIEKQKGILHLKARERTYRILLPEFDSIHSLRVNVKLEVKDKYHIDVVDLYSERQRKSFAKRIGQKFSCSESQIEQDLYRILEELEKDSGSKIEDGGNQKESPMTDEEKNEALKSLKNPNLIQEILEDLEKIGCVGEEQNKLLGYLVTISRKLQEPLSLTIVSQSGAGKSNLADVLESILPKEEVIRLSRITPQALYYMEKDALKRKVLIIEEKEGSTQADYSIRVLQSKKSLRLAVALKDPQTGKMKTVIFEVEGPVVVIETTTRTDINPENGSRVFIAYMDESEEQTKRIHLFQRQKKTIQGRQAKAESEALIRKHQNIQRLLQEIPIDIPYVHEIHFPSRWMRTRRDYQKFLNLIEAVTFLNQYQRQTKTLDDQTQYIESTTQDYKIAYSLACDIFGDCLSELMKPEREFYELIKQMLQEKELLSFQRRMIREYSKLPDHVVRRFLETLVQMEYLLVLEGKNGIRFEYKLNPEPQKKEVLQGLTTPEELEKLMKIGSPIKAFGDDPKATLRQPCVNLAARLNGLNHTT